MSALKYVFHEGTQGLDLFCKFSLNIKHDLDSADSFGNTALLKACYFGNLEAVKILLNFNADITAINYFGQNALTLATYSGKIPLVKELLKHRSYDDFNLSSMVPALCVATLMKNQQMVDFLIGLQSNETEIKTSHGLRCKDIQEMLECHSIIT